MLPLTWIADTRGSLDMNTLVSATALREEKQKQNESLEQECHGSFYTKKYIPSGELPVPDFLLILSLEIAVVGGPASQHNVQTIAAIDGDAAQKVDDNLVLVKAQLCKHHD